MSMWLIGYRDFVQVLPIWSVQVPAGRRINFEGLAFARKVILRQNTSDHAICQLRPLFPLNNSKILGTGLIIPLSDLNMTQSDQEDMCRRVTQTARAPMKETSIPNVLESFGHQHNW